MFNLKGFKEWRVDVSYQLVAFLDSRIRENDAKG